MTYRVIQWATGLVGQEAIKGVLAHPELELVGAWVHSPDKVGRDVGELCGLDPLGVTATGDLDEICAIDADCVVYAPVLASTRTVAAAAGVGEERRDAGRLDLPDRRRRSWRELEDACRRGNTTLHGTGINPGGITERFPLMLSAMCRNIRHVRVEEFSDIRNYPTESVVRDVMLFGTSPEQATTSPMPADPRRRVHAVDRHGRGRARLDARRGEAHDARDGRRDEATSTRRSACSRPGRSRRSGSRGRGWSTASR